MCLSETKTTILDEKPDPINHALNMGYLVSEIKGLLDSGIKSEELLILKERPFTAPEPIVDASVRPDDFSDAGNAEVFERNFGKYAAWTRGSGWFVWDGKRWENSDQCAVMLARALSGCMLDEATADHLDALKRATSGVAGEQDKKALADAKEYYKHAIATRRKPRLDAMLGLAQAGLQCDLSKFDPNPFDLNTPAGIVDLKTGELRPHSPGDMCSKITASAPGDNGKQMWDELLHTVSNGDDKTAWFLQQVAGMALIGKVCHEGIVLAHGGGRNGKSTFFNALADTMGDYAGHIAVNTLTTERTNKGATLATLRGKRLVLTGELEEHQRLSVAMLKALASTDTLVAEEKFRAPEEFKQSHTICLFTNHLPRVGSTDGGTWRRLTVVPFDAVIDSRKSVQNYGEILVREAAPAILQWAIEGAVGFVRNGCRLFLPDRVAEATEEYQAREDWLSNFIDERCTKGDRVSGGELYKAYREWAKDSGEYARRQSDFVAAMESAGYKKITSNGRNYWIGIELDEPQYIATQGFRR